MFHQCKSLHMIIVRSNISSRRSLLSNLNKQQQQRSTRLLTTATSNAIHKLKTVVEQFRVENYAQELPSRCKKEMIKAVDKEGDGRINADALTTLFENIGAAQTMTRIDVENIINELGDVDDDTNAKTNEQRGGTIGVDKMYTIM